MASQNNHVECCEILLKAGANVNLACTDGFTPLMISAQNGHDNCVEWLVNCGGAHLNIVNDMKFSALMLATAKGHVKIVKFLKRKGALLDAACTISDGNFTAADIARLHAAKNPDGAAVEKELKKVCFICGSGAGRITKCGECMSVYYCSKKHQVEHWPIHKSMCAEAKRKRERQQMMEAKKKEDEKQEDEKKEEEKKVKNEEEKKAKGDKKSE